MHSIEEIFKVSPLIVISTGMFLLFQEEMALRELKHFCSVVKNPATDHSEQTDLCVLGVSPRKPPRLLEMSPDTSGSARRSPVGV